MGGAALPIATTLVSGFLGQKGAKAQADAMSDANAQAAGASRYAADMQQLMGEKGMLAQLFLAQLAAEQANMGMAYQQQQEARALQAIEPFRRLGYGAIPSLVDLYNKSQGPLEVNVPKELQAAFDLQKEDAARQLNRQLASQVTLGSPIGASTAADAYRRLTTEQALQGYQQGLASAQADYARQWGSAMDLINMGANLGATGYGSGGAAGGGNLSNIYSNLGNNLAGTLSNTGQGIAGSYNNMAQNFANSAGAMGTAAGSSYANWANQLNSLAGMYMQSNPSAFRA
jgi:hypothetical protein